MNPSCGAIAYFIRFVALEKDKDVLQQSGSRYPARPQQGHGSARKHVLLYELSTAAFIDVQSTDRYD